MSAVAGGPGGVDVVSRFRRPGTVDEVELVRPGGGPVPCVLPVRWLTPAPGRDVIGAVLASVLVLELDHVAAAVADGRAYHVDALHELATRDGWSMTPVAGGYELRRDGDDAGTVVRGTDLLLALELTVRVAIEAFEGDDDPPGWVVRSRAVHPTLVDALGDEVRFELLD